MTTSLTSSRAISAEVRHVGVTAVTRFLDETWPELYGLTYQPTPYQHPDWLGAWLLQLGFGEEPYILTVRDSGGLQAALALVRSEAGDGRTRVVPLSSPAAESIRLTGPGAEDPAVAAAAVNHFAILNEDGALVRVPDVPLNSALGTQLRARWEPSAHNPYATITLPWSSDGLSRSTRRDHRRRLNAWNRLAAQGRHLYFRRSCYPTQLLEDYESLTRLHRLRNAARPAGDPHLVAQPGAGWTEVIQRCIGAVCIASLHVDSQMVAAQLCLTRDRHVYSALTAMDPAYQAWAPGHVLLQLLLDELGTDGHESLVLGRTTPAQRAYKDLYNPIWSQTLTFKVTT
ncbi:GNAT family N-acetyltransferase [Streptomyces sp. NPDC059631]|uniref:GNAT family N-acetyltransferase n=1 Tax=unclassified Streptomyces TaxID=2593676 RepID=UPI0036C656D8